MLQNWHSFHGLRLSHSARRQTGTRVARWNTKCNLLYIITEPTRPLSHLRMESSERQADIMSTLMAAGLEMNRGHPFLANPQYACGNISA